MEILHHLNAIPPQCRGGVLSIGKFDGLHRGHIGILRSLVKKARQYSLPSIVFTFAPSPAEILRPHLAPPLICDPAQKFDLISAFDPDYLVLYPTTREFLDLSAEDFFQRIVIDGLGAAKMVEGANFYFGRNRGGNGALLSSLCQKNGIDLELLPPVQFAGHPVSSSRVRALLREGEVERVIGMLKRPYRISGLVIDGDHRGRTLGFPTANLAEIKTLLPKFGVYAARTLVDGQYYPAAVNLGGNPTFGIDAVKTEVHILDFSGNLYGETIQVDFLARVRDITPFHNRAALLSQMEKDILSIRSHWSKWIDSDRMVSEETDDRGA